jgi:hypothetical protein
VHITVSVNVIVYYITSTQRFVLKYARSGFPLRSQMEIASLNGDFFNVLRSVR